MYPEKTTNILIKSLSNPSKDFEQSTLVHSFSENEVENRFFMHKKQNLFGIFFKQPKQLRNSQKHCIWISLQDFISTDFQSHKSFFALNKLTISQNIISCSIPLSRSFLISLMSYKARGIGVAEEFTVSIDYQVPNILWKPYTGWEWKKILKFKF